MKKVKIIGLALVLLLSLVSMTGCLSKNENNSSGNTNPNVGGTEAPSTAPKEPTVDLTMAFLTFTNVADVELVQEEINKITKEKINATVTLMPISIAAWQQQINLMLTGNEKLDLFVSSSNFSYGTQASRGQIIPLDDLLQSHGQDILSVVPEYILEGSRVGGKIYGVASMRDWASYFGFAMRKDIVDKHNIDLSNVKTAADLGAVFKIVQEKEPTLTPVVNSGGTTPVMRFMGDKYDGLGDFFGVIRMDGDHVINMFEDEEYIEAVNLSREWFQAGYILKDAATSQEAQANIVRAGRGFGYFAQMKPGFEVQENQITGYEMITVPLTNVVSFTNASTGFNMSIARNSAHPEKAMELMNLLYTDAEIMNLIANGIEGKHYQVLPEGVITLPDGVTESNYVFGQWQIGNNFLTYPWKGNDPDLWEQMMDFNNSAILSPAFGFTFNPDSVSTEIAASSNVLSQYRVGIEYGTLDPAKSLPEFNERLKAAGLERIIAEKQKQFDEWKANQ